MVHVSRRARAVLACEFAPSHATPSAWPCFRLPLRQGFENGSVVWFLSARLFVHVRFSSVVRQTSV